MSLSLAVAGLGCSSGTANRSTSPEDDAERAAKRAEDERFENWRKELDATRPEPPYETLAVTAYAAPERCGQGPYRIEVDALETEFYEELEIYACGPRRVEGTRRATYVHAQHNHEPWVSEDGFGSAAENEACVARAAERVEPAAGRGAGGAASADQEETASRSSSGAAVAAESLALEPLDEAPEDCEVEVPMFATMQRVDPDNVHRPSDRVWEDERFIVEFWSQAPNDLEGVSFVVRQIGVPDDVTEEQWFAYREAKSAWNKRHRAYRDAKKAAGRVRAFTGTERQTTPPPPAPKEEDMPPRPSENATWIAGYWHYEADAFHWISGFWRVPESDVRERKTVVASKPPPPSEPAEESRPPRPSERAVWVPGSWHWDGSAYLWVSGTWRIPPSEEHDWEPSRWIRAEGGVRLAPGGWKIEIRTR